MTNLYEDFAGRVNFAARAMVAGQRSTRRFDSCFEMHDGDAVATALYRRARKNPKLRAVLFKYLSRDVIIPAAFANRRRKDLKAWSKELQAKGRSAFEVMLAEQALRNAEYERARANP